MLAHHPPTVYADLTDIIFEGREKSYGAFFLRKHNLRYLAIATVIVAIIASAVVIGRVQLSKVMLAKAEAEKVKVVAVKISMNELPPPPPIDEKAPPPPPPMEKLPPPQVRTVAFRIPEPTPEEELTEEDLEEQTIAEVQELKEAPNIGFEDKEGAEEGFFTGEIEGTGVEEIPEVIVEPEVPDIDEFIFVEEEPQAINMEEIQKLIGYPQVARDAGIEGKVIVRVLVDKTGDYSRHRVINSSHPILTAAVEENIHKLRFTPAVQGGRPVLFWVNIPFVFTLLQ